MWSQKPLFLIIPTFMTSLMNAPGYLIRGIKVVDGSDARYVAVGIFGFDLHPVDIVDIFGAFGVVDQLRLWTNRCEKSLLAGLWNDTNLCYCTVTCKVFIESTSKFLNRSLRKLGQSYANSWHKIYRHANRRRACPLFLCATLTPLKDVRQLSIVQPTNTNKFLILVSIKY